MDRRLFLNSVQICDLAAERTALDVKNSLCVQTNLCSDAIYLIHNGKRLEDDTDISALSNVHAYLRVIGGKGGFGSMLRAIGAQIEKTTNREACRDLSGRRLRDINEEKRLKSWLDNQQNREDDAAEQKQKKIKKLLAKPKHEFKDAAYEQARSDLAQNVEDAIEEGFKKSIDGGCSSSSNGASTHGRKRKSAEPAVGIKKKRPQKGALWLGDDLSSSTDTDTDTDAASDANSDSNTDDKSSTKSNADSVHLAVANSQTTDESSVDK